MRRTSLTNLRLHGRFRALSPIIKEAIFLTLNMGYESRGAVIHLSPGTLLTSMGLAFKITLLLLT